jgi:hypothetical protein
LYTGVLGQITTSVKEEYFGRSYDGTIIDHWNSPMVGITHTFSHIPPVELTVKYNIGNRFSITSGVGYRSYYLKVKNNSCYNYTEKYDYIQIPIIFQYDIPLKKKGFSLFVQGGIGLDFEVNYSAWRDYDNEYYWGNKIYTVENSTVSYFSNGGYNYLIHAGIGFSYRFNSGVGISLLGRYNIGASYISKHSYHTIVKEVSDNIIEEEIKEQLYGKAECWNCLLGVTYTFKNKEKKKEN